MPTKLKPLWRCPRCGERFVTANIWHACGKYKLEDHFRGCEPHVFPLFKKFARMARACGPVRMIPQKSRIVFMVRVRYAGCVVRRSYLECGMALPRRVQDARFTKIERFASHFIKHNFRVFSGKDLDAQLQRWLREAYGVGAQEFIQAKKNGKVVKKLSARARTVAR